MNMLLIGGPSNVWFLVSRRLPTEEDGILSDQPLCRFLQGEFDFQLTTLKKDPADGKQRTWTALLVNLIEEEDDIKYVKSKMHTLVGPLAEPTRDMFELACTCTEQRSRSPAAQDFVEMRDGEMITNNCSLGPLLEDLKPATARVASA